MTRVDPWKSTVFRTCRHSVVPHGGLRKIPAGNRSAPKHGHPHHRAHCCCACDTVPRWRSWFYTSFRTHRARRAIRTHRTHRTERTAHLCVRSCPCRVCGARVVRGRPGVAAWIETRSLSLSLSRTHTCPPHIGDDTWHRTPERQRHSCPRAERRRARCVPCARHSFA